MPTAALRVDNMLRASIALAPIEGVQELLKTMRSQKNEFQEQSQFQRTLKNFAEIP